MDAGRDESARDTPSLGAMRERVACDMSVRAVPRSCDPDYVRAVYERGVEDEGDRGGAWHDDHADHRPAGAGHYHTARCEAPYRARRYLRHRPRGSTRGALEGAARSR